MADNIYFFVSLLLSLFNLMQVGTRLTKSYFKYIIHLEHEKSRTSANNS